MLDDKYGQANAVQPLDELRRLSGFLQGHAHCRLVEQENARIRCQRQTDLQPLLFYVGQRTRRSVRVLYEIEHLQCPTSQITIVEIEPLTACNLQVLLNGEGGVDTRGLEFHADAVSDATERGQRRDVFAVQLYRTPGWEMMAHDQAEQRRLARAIRTNEAAKLATPKVQRNVVHRLDPAERLRESGDSQYRQRIVVPVRACRFRNVRAGIPRPTFRHSGFNPCTQLRRVLLRTCRPAQEPALDTLAQGQYDSARGKRESRRPARLR